MRAILISSRANLVPMQLRGPKPNGRWTVAGRLALSSAANLECNTETTENECNMKLLLMMLYQPIWIKFLWVLPVFGIMVECFERQKDLRSLGNSWAITEGSGLGTHTSHTAECEYKQVRILFYRQIFLHRSRRVDSKSFLNDIVEVGNLLAGFMQCGILHSVPYSGKLSREKTFANFEGWER